MPPVPPATDESPKGLQGDGRHSAQSDQTQQHTQTTRQHTHTHQAGQRMQEKRVHGASRSWRVHGATRSWRGSWPGRTRSLPSSDRLRLRLLGVVIALGDARGHGDMMSRRSSIQQCSSQGEAHGRRHAGRLQAITPFDRPWKSPLIDTPNAKRARVRGQQANSAAASTASGSSGSRCCRRRACSWCLLLSRSLFVMPSTLAEPRGACS